MKVELMNSLMYEATLSLRLIPETDVERILLKAIWKHGRLEIVHNGYVVTFSGESGGEQEA